MGNNLDIVIHTNKKHNNKLNCVETVLVDVVDGSEKNTDTGL